MTRTNDDFIMLPTVDFCFKELMKDTGIDETTKRSPKRTGNFSVDEIFQWERTEGVRKNDKNE